MVFKATDPTLCHCNPCRPTRLAYQPLGYGMRVALKLIRFELSVGGWRGWPWARVLLIPATTFVRSCRKLHLVTFLSICYCYPAKLTSRTNCVVKLLTSNHGWRWSSKRESRSNRHLRWESFGRAWLSTRLEKRLESYAQFWSIFQYYCRWKWTSS